VEWGQAGTEGRAGKGTRTQAGMGRAWARTILSPAWARVKAALTPRRILCLRLKEHARTHMHKHMHTETLRWAV